MEVVGRVVEVSTIEREEDEEGLGKEEAEEEGREGGETSADARAFISKLGTDFALQ